MNFLTVIFIVVMAALFIYTAIRLSTAIQVNFTTSNRLRQQFAERIRMLRMFPMLRKRGIDIDSYLANLPISEIEQQIRSCESCDRQDECRSALEGSDADGYGFCANDENFKKILKTTK